MDKNETIEITNRDFRLQICPAAGGAIAGFWWQPRHRSEPFPVLRTASERSLLDGNGMDMACFPMVPYCNRVAHNRFRFDGRDWCLDADRIPYPHALHGYGWVAQWMLLRQSEFEVELAHRHLPARAEDPYDYLAQQLFVLDSDGLNVTLSVQNRAERPMLFGLGLHPWFNRTARVSLKAPARTVVLADLEQLPTDEAEIPDHWSYNRARELPADSVDNLFTDWPGRAEIAWPDAGVGLRVSADRLFGHYMLFAPDDRPVFCFEPVSHRVDGHNLPGYGGLVMLAPGESISGTVRFSPFDLESTPES